MTRVSSRAESGSAVVAVRPALRSSTWTSARPVLPLPSANGWIVSNWACVTAIFASAGRSVRRMNTQRSSMRAGTAALSGATNSAPAGLRSDPPIHTGSPRNRPAISGLVRSISMRCISRMVPGFSGSTVRDASSMALVLATISGALPREPGWSVPNISSSTSFRDETVRRSIREEALASPRSSRAVNGSGEVCRAASKRTISRVATSISANRSVGRPGVAPAISGTTDSRWVAGSRVRWRVDNRSVLRGFRGRSRMWTPGHPRSVTFTAPPISSTPAMNEQLSGHVFTGLSPVDI